MVILVKKTIYEKFEKKFDFNNDKGRKGGSGINKAELLASRFILYIEPWIAYTC